MDFISSILAGIIQGITEWLPISSSGHNMIALMGLSGLEPERAFSLGLYLHLGTLLAVLVKMRMDVRKIVMRLPRFREDRLVQFLLVSTILSALVGFPVYLFLKETIRAGQLDFGFATALIGFFLILTGTMLYLSQGIMGNKVVSELNFLDMAIAGIAQGFTPLPGISRSGTTIAVLLLRNIRQEDALRLSFLMSIPAITGAVLVEFLQGSLQSFDPMVILLGIVTAFIFGYLTIDLLLRFARRARFDIFCLAFGFVAIFSYLITTL
jgi:undecaprenyl-diphosphatase